MEFFSNGGKETMKHNHNKLLALLLVLCMMLPLCAVPAAATDAEESQPIDYQFSMSPSTTI